jgi:hypothetical protein
VKLHVDAGAAEGDSFHFEAEALVKGGVSLELDVASGTDDALPGEIDAGVKGADDLAGGAGVSGGFGNGAVGGDVAAWDFANGSEDAFSHRLKISGSGLVPWCTSGKVVGKPVSARSDLRGQEHLAKSGGHPCSPRGGVLYLQFFTGATQWKAGGYE